MKVSSIYLLWAIFDFIVICQGFVFGARRQYSGSIVPKEPLVCNGDDVTFKCQLFDKPSLDKKIHFAVKIPPKDYVIVRENDIDRENDTSANFTLRVAKELFMHVKCYYGQRDDVNNKALRIKDPVLFPIYTMPLQVQNFHCVVENYEKMVCSWEHGTEYNTGTMPKITFEWSISGRSDWRSCPELKNNGTLCIWPGINRNTSDDVLQSTLDIRIIQVQVCGESVSSNFTIKPKLLVKPDPITNLRSHPINSTCIRLQWNNYVKSIPDVTHVYRIRRYSIWNLEKDNDVIISGLQLENGINRLQTISLCDLEEDTKYTFSVEQKPDNKGFWSKSVTTENRTLKDVPSASPKVIPGGYYWDPKECIDGGKQRTVCLSWQDIDAIDKNGRMRGIDVFFTQTGSYEPEVHKSFSEDTTYGCARLSCNAAYTVLVNARNEIGMSHIPSTVYVQKWQKNVQQPSFTVEIDRRLVRKGPSEVFITFDSLQTDVSDIYVSWCVIKMGQCKNDGFVDWVKIASNKTKASIIPKKAGKYSYSVSVSSGDVSYGSHWQHCVYTKDVSPKVHPPNVIVTTGSEDNTLVVSWEKLGCTPGEPLIVTYRIEYCLKDSGKCLRIEVPSNSSKVVLKDLREDEEYTVQVQGLSVKNLTGPFSPAVSGTPVNKSLKLHVIIGISCAGLALVILATIGIVCTVRLMRRKAIRWRKKVGGVQLPETIDQNLTRDVCKAPLNLNVRKFSTDSGIPPTPSPTITSGSTIGWLNDTK